MSDRPLISIIVPVFNGIELAGDYVQSTYRQSSGRPLYLVRRVHDSATPAGALR